MLLGLGVLSLAVAGITAIAARLDCSDLHNAPGCGSGERPASYAILIGGGLGIVIGIPTLVSGVSKMRRARARARARLGLAQALYPTRSGIGLRF